MAGLEIRLDTDLSSIVDIILEFIEVCFHTILYARKVYPESIFVLKKKYNVPVHISLYPELNQYISDVLKCVKKLLMQNELKHISLWILDTSSNPVEKYIFTNFYLQTNESRTSLANIEETFRKVCLKLFTSDYILKPVPVNSSFRVFLKTRETLLPQITIDPSLEGFPWIAGEDKGDCKNKELVPLQTVDSSPFNLQIYLEI